MSLSLIRAGVEHLDVLVPLFDAYRQFYQQPSDLNGVRAYLHERLSRDEAVVFLAYAGDEAAGFTLLYPTLSSVSMRRYWTLNDLYVTPQARGQGVGGALLEHARQFGIEGGVHKLELQTAVTNATAQSVYEAHGWQRDTAFYRYVLMLDV